LNLLGKEQKLHPHERIYTFWKYFRNAFARDAGLRIDHLLFSPSIADRLVAAWVDREVRGREYASDDAPAWVEIADAKCPQRRLAGDASGKIIKLTDTFGLERFVAARKSWFFDAVLSELRAGRKRSHWMWFVFPQLHGLGRSSMAEYYDIGSLAEARAYLAHLGLGPRLDLCTRVVLRDRGSIASCDIRLSGRHEVPIIRNSVCGRGAGGRKPVSAPRSPVRRAAGREPLALLRGAP
jgi:hypothetical protein